MVMKAGEGRDPSVFASLVSANKTFLLTHISSGMDICPTLTFTRKLEQDGRGRAVTSFSMQ